MTAAYDELLDFVTSAPTLEEILEFSHSKATLDRVDYLLDAAEAETITGKENTELKEFLRANDVMEALKVRARKRLNISED